ncbi:MAG: putative heme transporter, partial [Solirubrobacteraceae bacterium]|nr:putative heme transporter [Solirubrobacteraceae bacterium]
MSTRADDHRASPLSMPEELSARHLVRRALQVIVLLAVLVLVAAFAPGLDEVRARLRDADPAWLAVGVLFEALSCSSYVLMFRPIFCAKMSWRASLEIAWSELAVGSLVPASGAGGLALGAWILR